MDVPCSPAFTHVCTDLKISKETNVLIKVIMMMIMIIIIIIIITHRRKFKY